MRIEQTQVFTYDELSESAKESARDNCRNWQVDESSWHEFVYEAAQDVAKILGIEFDERRVPLMNGETRGEPEIYFSGFWSQGDGASFNGSYSYKRGAARAIRKEFPTATDLHDIADSLQAIQRRNFYQLYATVSQNGRYSHSGTMSVSVERDSANYQDITEDAESDVTDAMRDFADWIYARLESEYEYLTSDESVAEMIHCNGYEFTIDGELH